MCSPGTYSNGMLCEPCPSNFYQPNDNSTTTFCFPCPKGTITLGGTGYSNCFDCIQTFDIIFCTYFVDPETGELSGDYLYYLDFAVFVAAWFFGMIFLGLIIFATCKEVDLLTKLRIYGKLFFQVETVLMDWAYFFAFINIYNNVWFDLAIISNDPQYVRNLELSSQVTFCYVLFVLLIYPIYR